VHIPAQTNLHTEDEVAFDCDCVFVGEGWRTGLSDRNEENMLTVDSKVGLFQTSAWSSRRCLKYFLWYSWNTLKPQWASMFPPNNTHLFWKFISLYKVNSSLFKLWQLLFSLLCLPVSLCSSLLYSPLSPHLFHTVHSSYLLPLHKDCLSCCFLTTLLSFLSPTSLADPLDICFCTSFQLTLHFLLPLKYVSVRNTLKLQNLRIVQTCVFV